MTPEHVRKMIAPLVDCPARDIRGWVIIAERILPAPGMLVTSDLHTGPGLDEETEMMLAGRLQHVIDLMSSPDIEAVWSMLPKARPS